MQYDVKYAPTHLAEIAFPDAATKALVLGIANRTLTQNLLLHGHTGSGKSALATVLAKDFAGAAGWSPAVFGPKDYRPNKRPLYERIEDEANGQLRLGNNAQPVILLDELDFCPEQAMLRVLCDQYANWLWIGMTNNISKVEAPLRDRLSPCAWNISDPKVFAPRALHVCQQELPPHLVPSLQELESYYDAFMPTQEAVTWRRAMKGAQRLVEYRLGHLPQLMVF